MILIIKSIKEIIKIITNPIGRNIPIKKNIAQNS